MESPLSLSSPIANAGTEDREVKDVYDNGVTVAEDLMDLCGEELNTSTPVDKQDVDKIDATLMEPCQRKGNDRDPLSTVYWMVEKEQSSSPLLKPASTSSPKRSKGHMRQPPGTITSTNRSKDAIHRSDNHVGGKGEMKVEELVETKIMEMASEEIKTPSRSVERVHPMYLNHPKTPRHNRGVYVNVSADFKQNPILASSVRSMRMMDEAVDHEDVKRSREVLGASRCWTDRFDEDMNGVLLPEDDDSLAAQTPIRSLSSYIPTSQSSHRYDSSHRSPLYRSGSPIMSGASDTTPSRRAVISGTPNRYTRAMFSDSDATDLDAFEGATLAVMRQMDMNPMAYATVSKRFVCESRMGDHLSTLYKHFKNMCTFIRRSSMRNDRPYFKVVQLMVQRMTRKSFTLEHLMQMAWLAPNLLSFKRINITDSVRRRYATEYRECNSDVVNDLQIRIHKLDGKVCSSTRDFENVCLAFKTIVCAWVARGEAEYLEEKGTTKGFYPDMALPIPTASFPCRYGGESSTVEVVMSSPTTTPSNSSTRLPNRMTLDGTKYTTMLTTSSGSAYSPNSDTTDPFKSPSRVSYKRTIGVNQVKSPKVESCSSKRSREATMLPMSTDLLDTPGMRRIRENARRLSEAAANAEYEKRHDASYWKDVRWFLNALVHLSINEEQPPYMRIEWLAEFMTKYCSKRVTYDNVSEWANTLAQLAPDVLDVGVSKFDDYSTMLTVQPNAKFDRIIQYVNERIGDKC
ncbi:hypothetical protein BgAZ_106270 [Babesia gibsoni]|uniref:CDT1 Geminin-binding domain-containing protein n=1 Tax=Babesia gibsoni TaxID=33632 RepID=A0AAD8PG62_BABGI|nr:hypothetical protein BgAZ_106270 [Babesia gibsoni]